MSLGVDSFGSFIRQFGIIPIASWNTKFPLAFDFRAFQCISFRVSLCNSVLYTQIFPQQALIKPQYVDHIPKAVQGNVGQVLEQKDERGMKETLCDDLELNQVSDRNVGDLSGGELQRFAIAVVAIQNAEIYMFDEPSSYLDVKQRLKAAQVIRSLLRPNR